MSNDKEMYVKRLQELQRARQELIGSLVKSQASCQKLSDTHERQCHYHRDELLALHIRRETRRSMGDSAIIEPVDRAIVSAIAELLILPETTPKEREDLLKDLSRLD